MSRPSDSSHGKISISFTGLLYGVVIDAALHRFHSFDMTPSHFLLILSLLLVVQDFFFYHLEIEEFNREFEEKEERAPNAQKGEVRKRVAAKERRIFVLDILVLGSWYTLALSADRQSVLVYLVCLSVFFVSVLAWEIFAPPEDSGPLRKLREVRQNYCKDQKKQSAKACWQLFWPTHGAVTLITVVVTALALLNPFGWLPAAHAAGQPASGHEAPARFFHYWSPAEWAFLAVPVIALLVWRFGYWVYHVRPNLKDDEAEKSPEEEGLEEVGESLEEVEESLGEVKAKLADAERTIISLSESIGAFKPLDETARNSFVALAADVPAINIRLEQMEKSVAALRTSGDEVRAEVASLTRTLEARLQGEVNRVIEALAALPQRGGGTAGDGTPDATDGSAPETR